MARLLTIKQLRFIDAYLSNGGNGLRAAAEAGYKGDYATLGSVAYENLKKPQIAAEINRRLSEYMTADEVLYRLSEIARGDLGDVLDEEGLIDLKQAKKMGKTRLLKAIKRKSGATNEVAVEQYSKVDALELLGKHHGLFVERVQVQDWRSEIMALLREGKVTPEQVRKELGDDIAQELLIRTGVSSAAERES